jgi:hypothetical protein
MSRLMTSTAIILTLIAGATIGQASAGNGALVAQLRKDVHNQAKIEQHRDIGATARRVNHTDIVLGLVGQGRMNLRAGQAVSNNKATTDQQGSANLAAIAQSGQNLTAAITQSGNANSATVRQFGRGNSTTITQTGDDNAACVIQIGRNLDTGVAQTGGQSTGVLQTRRGTREIPVELCTAAANLKRKDAKRLL